MKKSLFTAALACVLAIGGLTVSAQSTTVAEKVNFDSANKAFSSTTSENLKIVFLDMTEKADGFSKLSQKLSDYVEGKSFGVMLIDDSDPANVKKTFTALGDPSSVEQVGRLDVASIPLGKFKQGQTFQFGIGTDENDFEPIAIASVKDLKANGSKNSSITVAGDPLYYAGYNSDSFYQLDFSEDPFNGNIEILVMGEPLPASTVTLIVALGLAAAFLLYRNRRQRALIEQA